jgi:hypothetical protein
MRLPRAIWTCGLAAAVATAIGCGSVTDPDGDIFREERSAALDSYHVRLAADESSIEDVHRLTQAVAARYGVPIHLTFTRPAGFFTDASPSRARAIGADPRVVGLEPFDRDGCGSPSLVWGAIAVIVRDARTGTGALDGASGEVVDGDYREPLERPYWGLSRDGHLSANMSRLPTQPAIADPDHLVLYTLRPGHYTMVVRKPGYREWRSQDALRLDTGVCGGEPALQVVTALLEAQA